jgi:hypothetical protein
LWNLGYEQKINNHDWGDIPVAGRRVKKKKKTILCCHCVLEKEGTEESSGKRVIIRQTVWIPKKMIKGDTIDGWKIAEIYRKEGYEMDPALMRIWKKHRGTTDI